MPNENPDETNNRPGLEPEGYLMTFHFYVPTSETPSSAQPTRRNTRNTSASRFQRYQQPGVRQFSRASELMELFHAHAELLAASAFHNWLFSAGDEHLQGQPPASEAAMLKLKVLKCLSEKRRRKHVNCAICQEDFPDRKRYEEYQKKLKSKKTERAEDAVFEELLRMPCGHLYHRTCLSTWLRQSATCPTCRYEIDTDNPEYNVGVRNRMRQRDLELKKEADTDDEDDVLPGPSGIQSNKRKAPEDFDTPEVVKESKTEDRPLRRSARLKEKLF